MKGFKKLSVSGEFKPAELPLPAVIKEDACVWNVKPRDKSHRIYFLPSALRDLDEHIWWGQYTKSNHVEQGGLMVGNVFVEPGDGFVYAIVEHLVPMHGAKGSPGFLEMDTDAFYDAIQEAQKLIDQNNSTRQIGWYHTHPNTLDVFMSDTDRRNQRHSFSQDWQFAVVLNPHRKICRAFHGGEIKEAYCCFLCINDRNGPSVKKFRDLNRVPFTSLPTRNPKPINTEPVKILTPPQKPGVFGKELPFSYNEITKKYDVGEYDIQCDSFVNTILKRLNFTGVPGNVTLRKLLRIGLEHRSQGADLGKIHVIRETTWFDEKNCLNIEYGDLRMEQDSFLLNLAITNNPEMFGSIRNLNEQYPLLVLSDDSYTLYDPNGSGYQEEPATKKEDKEPQIDREEKIPEKESEKEAEISNDSAPGMVNQTAGNAEEKTEVSHSENVKNVDDSADVVQDQSSEVSENLE